MRFSSDSLDPFALPHHGGELALAEARFGQPEKGWLDLSTGINPFAYPVPTLPQKIWERLPDAADDWALREVAAANFGVEDPDWIVCAPGSQAVLQLLPRLRPFSQVAVIGPTYGEYQRCFSAAGHIVTPMETLDRAVESDIVVVCNPNNPDGRRQDPARMLDLAEDLARKGGFLLIDEAFIDVMPDLSLARHAKPGLMVLRSFGKFFGLAGLRLGFLVADPQTARIVRHGFGPWAVGGAANAIGRAALADRDWIAATRQKLQQETNALHSLFGRSQLSVLGGTSLFTLVNAPRAWALYEYLGQRGILARPFAMSPRWLRFGLPPDDAARQRLAAALAEWV